MKSLDTTLDFLRLLPHCLHFTALGEDLERADSSRLGSAYDQSRKHKRVKSIGLAYHVNIQLLSSEALSTSLQFSLMKDLQRFTLFQSEEDPQIAGETLILFL